MADKITMSGGVLVVPDEPIIPYVEGDGTGVDIWPAAQLVMNGKSLKFLDIGEGADRRAIAVRSTEGASPGLLWLATPLVASDYVLSQLILIGIYGIAALGLNVLVGFTGQISLGHGAFFGFGAFASAWLGTKSRLSPTRRQSLARQARPGGRG